MSQLFKVQFQEKVLKCFTRFKIKFSDWTLAVETFLSSAYAKSLALLGLGERGRCFFA